MASKKDTDAFAPQGDTTQVQQLLELRGSVAEELHDSTSRAQAEQALAAISNADETTQVALVKALARQRDTDAADVLLAVNELTANKAVRKESRRALIQLAGARVYPSWTPEQEQAAPMPVENPPRFWKGYVTQSREEGEVQLVLCWEQGFEYGQARMMGFLLDFWREGVKDFFTETGGRRRIESRVQEMKNLFASQEAEGVEVADCTLAEARRLLLDALDVNKWRGTTPHKDYRHYLPTVQQLVLNAKNVGEDSGRTFIRPDLPPDEVVANFVGGWSLGDCSLCYDLLTDTSELREGHSRDEWVDVRRKWADEAHPARMSPTFIREREHNQQSLWLPGSVISSRASTRREVEIGWSLELLATPLSGTLPEMPMGTAVYKETGRHWFWTTYTLAQEDGQWRISSMTDEGAKAQGLPVAELERQLKEHDERIQAITSEHSPTEPDAARYYEEIIWRLVEAMHLADALLVKLPFDRAIYEDAASRAMGIRMAERALVYAGGLAERFSATAMHGEDLRRLGALQVSLADQFVQFGMDERAEQFFELAEETIQNSLKVEDNAMGHMLLGELSMQKDEYEDAIAQFELARPLVTNRDEEAQLEFDIGSCMIQLERFSEAASHLERVAEINPNYEGIWFNIGYVQRVQKNYAEAELYYKRAIEQVPGDVRPYSELGSIYMNANRLPDAYKIVEQGIAANPLSAHLKGLLAGVLLEMGDRKRARVMLEEAEQIDPNQEVVRAMRQMLDAKQR
ncbi:MAG TPA: tetratricopeptide repeat protein [Ktedonobacteraceae bacterium]|nr:tetratricopeptide repeat protein [Ktedonobacteraceae bacterium]